VLKGCNQNSLDIIRKALIVIHGMSVAIEIGFLSYGPVAAGFNTA
jgi:hypothetical protein